MKPYSSDHLTLVTRPAPRYPNQADRRYFEKKLLDGITSVISGAGIMTIFLCLILT